MYKCEFRIIFRTFKNKPAFAGKPQASSCNKVGKSFWKFDGNTIFTAFYLFEDREIHVLKVRTIDVNEKNI